ncbi:hypothetical protein GCM10023336_22700 [Streptomyces similanensis]|uniref:Uncharacterized protein n=1 Tax=Streptomyces similanensis TaxID=1274988 RepID=A0ABP9K7J5_9ACTN
MRRNKAELAADTDSSRGRSTTRRVHIHAAMRPPAGARAHRAQAAGGGLGQRVAWKVRRYACGETPIEACRCWRRDAPVANPTRPAI